MYELPLVVRFPNYISNYLLVSIAYQNFYVHQIRNKPNAYWKKVLELYKCAKSNATDTLLAISQFIIFQFWSKFKRTIY